ncbi:MAG: ATP-binding cassette domain-containing protein, partial [Gammaproteobacteria bacterium]|nr:ATP-binding cassette domain-containing protein [Gammaproteobacteria bacterium]
MPPSSINPEQAALCINGLCCARAERELIHDLNQNLQAGQGLRVTGANGSGKTTLLRIIAGLSSDYSGEVRWADCDIRLNPGLLREHLLFIGHRPGVKAALTPLENLHWWHSLFASGAAVAAASLRDSLAAFGLAAQIDTP